MCLRSIFQRIGLVDFNPDRPFAITSNIVLAQSSIASRVRVYKAKRHQLRQTLFSSLNFLF
jgi:hypothetical protein